jgi:hypothetical protein
LLETKHITSDTGELKVALTPGIYMLQISTSAEIFTTKIIITE